MATIAVVGVAFAIACLHLVLGTRVPLSVWKGGGFGMYADMHPFFNRSVWLEMEGGTEPRAVRLVPTTQDLEEWADALPHASQMVLVDLIEDLSDSRAYPSRRRMRGLVERLGPLIAAGLPGLDSIPSVASVTLVYMEVRPVLSQGTFEGREILRYAYDDSG